MGAQKLCLEAYIRATESPSNLSDLTKDDISQILFMHGYRIPHKTKKVDMVELLCGVELLVPRRSTVEASGVSPAAHFLPEEMKRDLALLNWGECQVQSILSSINPSLAVAPIQRTYPASRLPIVSAAESKKNRRRRMEKMKKVADGENGFCTPMAVRALVPVASPQSVIETS